MNFLSAEEINKTSPYKVTQVDEMSVRFSTQNGVRYWIGLTMDIFILTENGYYLYIINENEPKAEDPLIFKTIVAIIANFFSHSVEDAMLYICSPSDSRQASRARLFQIWFNSAQESSQFSLITYSNKDDEIDYYYGMILRKDNPFYAKIVGIFKDFLSDI